MRLSPLASGRVSVVIVNYKGAEDTIACLEGLLEVDWPDVEAIVVDNASGDGSVEAISSRFPEVRLLALDENLGFAGGCNRAAAAATGEYVAFLNNDARPDRDWLSAAVAGLQADPSVGCVASKVLDWEGTTVDYVTAALAFFGHGFKLNAGDPDSPVFDEEHDVIFASGAAMVMPTSLFVDSGGFDASYFMFFEDVDLGWRLWLLGYRVRFIPGSVVYHRHHRSMEGFAGWREQFLLERNALATIFKNYDDENLLRAFPASLLLLVRRGISIGGADSTAFDLRRAPVGEEAPEVTVHPQTLVPSFAIDQFVEMLPELLESRRRTQLRRQRPDAEIFRQFRMPLLPNLDKPAFLERFAPVVEAFSVAEVFGERRRIVIATGDTLAPRMAGPAIRAWQIACALSSEHDVKLVTTNTWRELSNSAFEIRHVNDESFRDVVEWSDIVLFQGLLMRFHPWLRTTSRIVIADIYDPFHLEALEQARDSGAEVRRESVRAATDVLNEQLTRGDLFLCASEKQRDFWLGQLSAVGRINPSTYDHDENLRQLIKIVPFGVSDVPPRHTRPALKGVVPGIGPDDKVVLWGGGIYNWFDPLTLLRAVDKLRARLPEVRVFFLGLSHPNPDVPEMRMAVEARRLADDLGLTGTHVFFNEGWVEYEDRQNYLLEADLGVSTHLEHVETEFSFRTRILDYLWASLPVVATRGDSFASLIEDEGVGITVPAGDLDALEAALFTILDDDDVRKACAARAGEVGLRLRWSEALMPLIEFCRAPQRAPDLLDPESALGLVPPSLPFMRRRDLVAALALLRSGSFGELVTKLKVRFRRIAASTR